MSPSQNTQCKVPLLRLAQPLDSSDHLILRMVCEGFQDQETLLLVTYTSGPSSQSALPRPSARGLTPPSLYHSKGTDLLGPENKHNVWNLKKLTGRAAMTRNGHSATAEASILLPLPASGCGSKYRVAGPYDSDSRADSVVKAATLGHFAISVHPAFHAHTPAANPCIIVLHFIFTQPPKA